MGERSGRGRRALLACGAVAASAALVAAAVALKPAHSSSAASAMARMGMSAAGAGYWDAVGGGAVPAGGETRTYYVGADEVVWDYAPEGRNEITGEPFDRVADTYVRTGPGRIGSRYLKCLYRGYTDSSFTHREPRPADDAYLGLLGPVIRAEVGDTIRLVFRNACPFPASVHPHGVFYEKDSEGAPYNDGTSGKDKADDAVPPGGRHTSYQLDSYRHREHELGGSDFVHGQFGEKFTVDGLSDGEVCICDRYRIGTATPVAGTVDYDPDPVEPPPAGACSSACSRARDDLVLDM